ncbi:MAG: 16S rRNA (cytosine(967)-C(5))-methyltransferase [Chlorobium sp.]|uniref:16S rRNA (cytosine(967)-C(5))-methyltransferase RsmB n=1 Tax=Chlorobium sp. TaxID=1095 RepID=UPI0025B88C37|nr:16S rRNA (cytosine(967)-C(5))-methyltransferase RsmB [Chlorobium sp.]MCF8383510.1 16S rRNA (cytosine(967)-C(5))-methyltransferase [Chlorobium sp.]
MTSRELALKVLQNVEQGEKKSGTILHELLDNSSLCRSDRALATELVNGVLRRRMTLDAVIGRFYHHRYEKTAPVLKNILRIAAYQLIYLNRIPQWAAVSESVVLARKYKGERMARLANAVLRNITPESAAPENFPGDATGTGRMAVIASHPEWMLERWIARYGKKRTEVIVDYNNRTPLTGFRINALKCDPKKFYAEHGSGEALPVIRTGLDNFFLSADFSCFEAAIKQGLLTVQNPTQGLVCLLCNPAAGSTVLDLCAAPGGKSTFLGELMQNRGSITAVDLYSRKLQKLTGHSGELGITVIAAVAADARSFQPETPPESILLDAPCSGTGVLARRAELRWKLTPQMIAELVALQAELLDHAASLLAENGILIYATCSIEPEENELQIEAFLGRHPEFRRESSGGALPEPFASEASGNGSILTLPGQKEGFDGGFAQRMKKISS